jgi:hypothetical protein
MFHSQTEATEFSCCNTAHSLKLSMSVASEESNFSILQLIKTCHITETHNATTELTSDSNGVHSDC